MPRPSRGPRHPARVPAIEVDHPPVDADLVDRVEQVRGALPVQSAWQVGVRRSRRRGPAAPRRRRPGCSRCRRAAVPSRAGDPPRLNVRGAAASADSTSARGRRTRWSPSSTIAPAASSTVRARADSTRRPVRASTVNARSWTSSRRAPAGLRRGSSPGRLDHPGAPSSRSAAARIRVSSAALAASSGSGWWLLADPGDPLAGDLHRVAVAAVLAPARGSGRA